jgi:hypothetical protein
VWAKPIVALRSVSLTMRAAMNKYDRGGTERSQVVRLPREH